MYIVKGEKRIAVEEDLNIEWLDRLGTGRVVYFFVHDGVEGGPSLISRQTGSSSV